MSPAGELTDLLDVQFWLMGRDVEHPSGNLLCALGFDRERSRRRWPSRYRRAEPEGSVIVWRCGLYLPCGADGLLLPRGLVPAMVEAGRAEEVYDPTVVVALWREAAACPVPGRIRAAHWFAGYEAAVAGSVGVAHRVPARGTRPTLAPPEPCSLEERWRALAARLTASGPAGLPVTAARGRGCASGRRRR